MAPSDFAKLPTPVSLPKATLQFERIVAEPGETSVTSASAREMEATILGMVLELHNSLVSISIFELTHDWFCHFLSARGQSLKQFD